VTGRPDGKRPFGYPSLLEYYQARLAKYRAEHAGSDDSFSLNAEDCSKLQIEALQYHHRYICFLQLEEYDSVIRDTERNLTALDFAEDYAETDELSWSVQMLRPQLLMMRVRAQATIALKTGDFTAAMEIIEAEIQHLREFYEAMDQPDLLEESGEIASLESWLEDIRAQRPLSRREQLEQALADALHAENYEKAAQVRDALRKLGKE
jgi:hypothetical protein